MKPTEEQIPAIEHDGNLVITAKPGSGKTFTIVEKIKAISRMQEDYQGVIAISFTNKASKELEGRCIRGGVEQNKSFFGTIDSFFLGVITIPFIKHLFDCPPEIQIVRLEDYPEYSQIKDLSSNRTPAAEKALADSIEEGLVFLDVSGEVALYVIEKAPGCALFLRARYTHLFIDEYQDCGQIQHEFFTEMARLGITCIAVGDLDQAIYGFAGKHSKHLLDLSKDPAFKHVSITKNHRCHESISRYSLQLLGIPNEPLPKDRLRVFAPYVVGNEQEIVRVIEKRLPEMMEQYEVSSFSEVAILCRSGSAVNAIANFLSIPFTVPNSTLLEENGTPQARFFVDFFTSYYSPTEFAGSFIDRYLFDDEGSRYRKAQSLASELFSLEENELSGNKEKLISLMERVEIRSNCDSAIEALENEVSDLGTLKVNYGMANDGEINLMTLHKSKGLEFDIVFHMDAYRFIMPLYRHENPTDTEYTQALNLHYVGITRARKACYLMQGSMRTNSSGVQKKAEPSLFLTLNGLPNFRITGRWR